MELFDRGRVARGSSRVIDSRSNVLFTAEFKRTSSCIYYQHHYNKRTTHITYYGSFCVSLPSFLTPQNAFTGVPHLTLVINIQSTGLKGRGIRPGALLGHKNRRQPRFMPRSHQYMDTHMQYQSCYVQLDNVSREHHYANTSHRRW